MQDIKRTIDRIIKIVPSLQEPLLSIREKAKKSPQHNEIYWKQLLNVLNSEKLSTSLVSDIKRILNPPHIRPNGQKSSFPEVGKNEQIVGTIPDHISDKLHRYDRAMILIGKSKYEASATNNTELLSYALRKEALMEISLKKIWVELRDQFNLWGPSNFAIGLRKRENTLVLVIQKEIPRNNPPLNLFRMFGIIPEDPDSTPPDN